MSGPIESSRCGLLSQSWSPRRRQPRHHWSAKRRLRAQGGAARTRLVHLQHHSPFIAMHWPPRGFRLQDCRHSVRGRACVQSAQRVVRPYRVAILGAPWADRNTVCISGDSEKEMRAPILRETCCGTALFGVSLIVQCDDRVLRRDRTPRAAAADGPWDTWMLSSVHISALVASLDHCVFVPFVRAQPQKERQHAKTYHTSSGL